jgi:hypothetical protein
MRFKKLLGFLALAFGVFFLIQAPAEAAHLVKVTGETAREWFGVAAESLMTFVRSLTA